MLMIKVKNEIYSLVDEEFLSYFSETHKKFMIDIYYEKYKDFCNHIGLKSHNKDVFLKNASRRRVSLYQLCCPNCKTIAIFCNDKRIHKNSELNYCVNCGRGSIIDNIGIQISRFLRILEVNKIGIDELKKNNRDIEDWIIGFDCYQMQIIALATLIETFFREYFNSLMYINNFGTNNDFINKIISNYTRNDFMNIDKANEYYKKAFSINLKNEINKDIWDEMTDIIHLRNMMVHNNGLIDSKFESSSTYERIKDKINGKFCKLEKEDIDKYFTSVLKVINVVSTLFLKEYFNKRNIVVANYYFNNAATENSDSLDDKSKLQ